MIKGPGLLPLSGGKAKKLVVLLHGYGSNGEDLLSLAPHWSRLMPDVEFLAPNGLEPWEAYVSGYQWFSLKEFTPFRIRSGLDAVRPILEDYLLIELARRGLNPQDLAIVGFSQGGMVALDIMFAIPDLGGIICYSGGFYPSLDTPLQEPYPSVLLVHGDVDTVVPYHVFLETQQQLKKIGIYPQTLTCLGLGHSIDKKGITGGAQFLINLFDLKPLVTGMKQH